jgi:hypothetical protein
MHLNCFKLLFFFQLSDRFLSYEPELHPGATYRFKEVSATLKIFQTGAITITAPSVLKVQQAVEHIYPLVYLFKKEKPPPTALSRKRAMMLEAHNNPSNGIAFGQYRSGINGKRRKVFDNAMEEDEEDNEIFLASHVWSPEDNY